MFTSKVAKPQTKAAAGSTDKLMRSATRPFGGGVVEQALMLQSAIGNQATLRLLSQRAGNVVVGEVNDSLEREADRVADHVMCMAAPVTPVIHQPSREEPVLRRAPEAEQRSPAKNPKSLPEDPGQKYPQFVAADQVLSLKRGEGDDWQITMTGHIKAESVRRSIWPTRAPPSVVITLLDALIEPTEIGTFHIDGLAFSALKGMDSSMSRLFVAHGLEDETQESPAVKQARAEFRAEHDGHGEWVLDSIDVALRRITKRNPDLLVAYYKYYAQHELTDTESFVNGFGFDEDKNTGATASGNTKINTRVLQQQSGFPTDDPLSLLGGTLMHEYVHTPQGSAGSMAAQFGPEEAKAYAVEKDLQPRLHGR